VDIDHFDGQLSNVINDKLKHSTKMKNRININKLNWLLEQAEPGDHSVYEQLLKEYNEIEKQLLIDIPNNKHDLDLVQKHRDLNKVLANWPPFAVDEYNIFDKAKDYANEDSIC